MYTFEVRTAALREFRDITAEIASACPGFGSAAALLVQVPHTTAGVTVNEGFDPDVAGDLMRALEALVPRVRFDHGEGNSAAHLLTTLVGSSTLVPLQDGRLQLGRWQRVFLCEFDGPRDRQVRLVPLPAAGA